MILAVVLTCLAAAVVAAPQGNKQVVLTKYEHNDSGDGNFNYAIDADNGISVSVSGSPGTAGQVNMQGFYTYVLDDGTPVRVPFVADENGFRPDLDQLLRLLHLQPIVIPIAPFSGKPHPGVNFR
nr:cuticle protein AMP4-like [Procambarus clarkii]